MNTWLLIMVLSSYKGGKAIEAVPGFESKVQCELAGRDFVAASHQVDGRATFSCSLHGPTTAVDTQ